MDHQPSLFAQRDQDLATRYRARVLAYLAKAQGFLGCFAAADVNDTGCSTTD